MPSRQYTPDADVFLWDFNPDSNYGSDPTIAQGMAAASKGGDEIYRSLLKFDISDLIGETVGAASRLDVLVYTAGGGDDFTCHRVTQTGWVESEATWNKYKNSVDWSAPGGDFSAPIVAFTSPTSTGTQTILTGSSLASFLQDALDNRSGIVHMLLKVSDEVTGVDTEWRFRSKEYFASKLTVVYGVATPAAKGYPWES